MDHFTQKRVLITSLSRIFTLVVNLVKHTYLNCITLQLKILHFIIKHYKTHFNPLRFIFMFGNDYIIIHFHFQETLTDEMFTRNIRITDFRFQFQWGKVSECSSYAIYSLAKNVRSGPTSNKEWTNRGESDQIRVVKVSARATTVQEQPWAEHNDRIRGRGDHFRLLRYTWWKSADPT